jgi:hypothetical protein
MNLTKDQVNINHVNAVNARADYLNHVVPQLIARLREGYTLKADGVSFFQKDKKELAAILNSIDKPAHLRVRFEVSPYSVWLKCDIHYANSDCSCKYSSDDVYLMDGRNLEYEAEYHPRAHITVETITTAIEEYQRLEAEAQKIRHAMFEAKRIIES